MAHLLRTSTPVPNSVLRLALRLVPLAPTSIFRRASFRLQEASTPAQNGQPIAARPAAAREKENPALLLRSQSRPEKLRTRYSCHAGPHAVYPNRAFCHRASLTTHQSPESETDPGRESLAWRLSLLHPRPQPEAIHVHRSAPHSAPWARQLCFRS